jgi:hypothetical protein
VIGLSLGALLLAVFAAGMATRGVFAQPDGNTIYACMGERSGTVRLVEEGESCARGEVLVSWNRVGPAGPRGPQGDPGPAGPPGASGQAGEDAPQVVQGWFRIDDFGQGTYTILSGDGFGFTAIIPQDSFAPVTVVFAPGTWAGDGFAVLVFGGSSTSLGTAQIIQATNVTVNTADGSGSFEIPNNGLSAFVFTAVELPSAAQ